MAKRITVGIVAPSSVVPRVELSLGLDKLKDAGFSVRLHPQCKQRHLFFAGTDEQRAEAFYEYAVHPGISILWCARGGYGAIRVLPLLDRLASQRGIPERKLLIGASDSTAILEYVRSRWGWATLHAPMPALRNFHYLQPAEWKALVAWAQGEESPAPWKKQRLRFFGSAPSRAIEAPLVGGNLATWASMIGSSFSPKARGKILFLEDVDESFYRLDRLVQQVKAARGFEDVRAIVLGNFLNCKDIVPQSLKKRPPSGKAGLRVLQNPKDRELGPVRPQLKQLQGLEAIFGVLSEDLGIPVAWGLPAGHGPGRTPLPLGGRYQLKKDGSFDLVEWDWISAGT